MQWRPSPSKRSSRRRRRLLTCLSEAYRRGQTEAHPTFVRECLICNTGGLRASNRPCVRQLSASQKYPDDTRIASCPIGRFCSKEETSEGAEKACQPQYHCQCWRTPSGQPV